MNQSQSSSPSSSSVAAPDAVDASAATTDISVTPDVVTAAGVSSNWSLATSSSSSEDSGMSDSEVCRYFSRGMCRFGEMCRFAHVLGENLWAANLYTPTTSSSSYGTNGTGTVRASSRQGRHHQRRPSNPAPARKAATATTPRTSWRSSTNSSNNNPSDSATASTNSDDNTTVEQPPPPQQPLIVPSDPSSWVLAPVFVPNHQRSSPPTATAATTTTMTYAQVVGDAPDGGQIIHHIAIMPETNADDLERIDGGHSVLCPYLATGRQLERPGGGPPMCRYGTQCVYDHGELCDMCSRWCLHPTDEAQRKDHQMQCMLQHEANMELSFAVARSKDKTCGICFEVIMEKAGREQRFGILPNCNHIFCLQCIRKWRLAKQFDNKIIRACPECRVTSDFVCPSAYWVDTKEEKEKLLGDYRGALGVKDCKYFKKGNGKCPFGNKCFYRHALENGQLVDVGVPQRATRRHNHLGEVDALQFFLWDFMDDRDTQWLDDIAVLLSDEDEDDEPVLELVERMLARSNNGGGS